MNQDDKDRFGDDEMGHQIHAHFLEKKAAERVATIRHMARDMVVAQIAAGQEGVERLTLSAVRKCALIYDEVLKVKVPT